MVAINFKKEFVGAILAGDKAQTIRQKARCKPGDKLQLYTGQRTKYCKKISDAICTHVHTIEIDELLIKLEGIPLDIACMTQFAQADGFTAHDNPRINTLDFLNFFRDNYGLPFKGYVIKWKLEPTNSKEVSDD